MSTVLSMNTEEMLKEAGLDFEVFPMDLKAVKPTEAEWSLLGVSDDFMLPVMNMKATARLLDDQPHILGIVGKNYSILQNREAFSVFDPLFENNLVHLEKAGSFDNGARVFIQARINNDQLEVVPGDVITPYMLLAHSHDGSLAVHCGFADERVSCKNSLNRIVTNKSGNNKFKKIRHKGNVLVNIEALRETMDLYNQDFICTVNVYKQLAGKQINSDEFKEFVKKVFSVTDKPIKTAEDEERKSRIIDDLENAFFGSPGNDLPGAKGSLWAAYNAVTFFTRYERGNKNTNDEKRLNSVYFGDGKRINEKALELAVSML